MSGELPPPRLSVVLPTTRAWPAIERALDTALDQSCAEPYEVLVMDGHGAALAREPQCPARWIRAPGADVFQLRALGVGAARGDVVVLSEDHCVAPRDWCRRMLAAHRNDPAVALVGAVVNHADSTKLALDRASFLLTLGRYAPPIAQIDAARLPVPTNLSVKRAALPAGPLRPGWIEYDLLADLRRRGQIGVAADVLLEHRQCWRPWPALAVHFHSGRCYGASTRGWSLRQRLRWFGKLCGLPRHLYRITRPALERGAGGASPRTADRFWLGGLILDNVLGQVVGALAGPGVSRRRLA